MKTQIITYPLIALTLAIGACGVAEEPGDGAIDSTLPIEELDMAGKADGASAARFETFVGLDGQTYFHLIAANGEKVLHSEGYASAQKAEEGIVSVRENAVLPESYELFQTVDGQWYFNLVAQNGEIVASSELYVTRANAERAAATVASLAKQVGTAPAVRSARFQIFKGLDGQHYFHLRAGNGQIVLTSEGYTRKTSAKGGIASVLAHGGNLGSYEVRDAADGQAYFVLKAVNGEIIGVSETYVSRWNAERAAARVAELIAGLAPQAPVAQQAAQ